MYEQASISIAAVLLCQFLWVIFCFCRSLPNLSELNLRSCKIADAGMEALAEALLVKRNIKKLDLRYDVIMTHDLIIVILCHSFY